MKKSLMALFMMAALLAPVAAFAEEAMDQLNEAASDSSSFDGGSGSTLDSPDATNYEGQGTFHAEANS